MGDTIVTIVAIFIVAALMLLYPLLVMSENNERVTRLAAQTITSEFVDTVTTRGEIRQSDYDEFIQRLYATGNTFDIEIEIRHLDENPGKKTVITTSDAIGENLTFSVFTSTILDEIMRSDAERGDGNGGYVLRTGDTIIVSVSNTNRTIAQLLRDFFYSIVGRSDHQIQATFSGMVMNNGRL